jgi:hypothetical protein
MRWTIMMLTCILNFHMSSDMHFGRDLSSDMLKVLGLCRLMGQVGPLTTTGYRIGYDGCKKQS